MTRFSSAPCAMGDRIDTWKGKLITEMSRDELVEALKDSGTLLFERYEERRRQIEANVGLLSRHR